MRRGGVIMVLGIQVRPARQGHGGGVVRGRGGRHVDGLAPGSGRRGGGGGVVVSGRSQLLVVLALLLRLLLVLLLLLLGAVPRRAQPTAEARGEDVAEGAPRARARVRAPHVVKCVRRRGKVEGQGLLVLVLRLRAVAAPSAAVAAAAAGTAAARARACTTRTAPGR